MDSAIIVSPGQLVSSGITRLRLVLLINDVFFGTSFCNPVVIIIDVVAEALGINAIITVIIIADGVANMSGGGRNGKVMGGD